MPPVRAKTVASSQNQRRPHVQSNIYKESTKCQPIIEIDIDHAPHLAKYQSLHSLVSADRVVHTANKTPITDDNSPQLSSLRKRREGPLALDRSRAGSFNCVKKFKKYF
jgi:hypothetical protein